MALQKKGKFVYKNQDSLNKMHAFYDKTLAALGVSYTEDYFETSFGKTHCLLVGDKDKPRIYTIHGGNGIHKERAGHHQGTAYNNGFTK